MAEDDFQDVASLKAKLEAQEKTLRVLMRQVESGESRESGALERMRSMHELQRLVEQKTRELEAERGRLADTLAYLKSTQDQLLQAQKLEAVGQLAAGVAHDFNNLLTVISCNADFLALERAEDQQSLERIHDISRAAGRAADLTKQLLAFSRKQVMKPQVLDVNVLIARMRGMLQCLIGEQFHIITRLQSGLPCVEFDPSQIEQIIMNLVVNARDAMPSGGDITLETSSAQLDDDYAHAHPGTLSGPHLLITITDTGTGMLPQVQEKIFEPFFTTKGQGKGTGLGLSTVYGIVKQGGGDIRVESRPGRGTKFGVFLPTTDKTPPADTEKPAVAHEAGQGKAVLVVEDEESVRKMACAILQRGGYAVLDTGDVDKAVELCSSHGGPLDVLLTDVTMPKVNGPKLAERLHVLRPSMKIVYMSGYTGDALDGIPAAIKGVPLLEKPFTPEQLLSKITEALNA